MLLNGHRAHRRSTGLLGFSLVELIVALAVFSFVITISVGSLLALISANQKMQAEQSIMTNLSFALDTMTRELRTGTAYFCDSDNNPLNNMFDTDEPQAFDLDVDLAPTDTQDCPLGNNNSQILQGVAFVEGGESITKITNGRILYYYDSDYYFPGGVDDHRGAILRRIGSEVAQPITSSGIYVTKAEFYVSGSEPLSTGDDENDQASVTIYLEAVDVADPTMQPYRLQTTITQRTLDL